MALGIEPTAKSFKGLFKLRKGFIIKNLLVGEGNPLSREAQASKNELLGSTSRGGLNTISCLTNAPTGLTCGEWRRSASKKVRSV